MIQPTNIRSIPTLLFGDTDVEDGDPEPIITSRCTNGTKRNPATKDGEDCQSCNAGFTIEDDRCRAFNSVCTNGTKKAPATKDGEDCRACNNNFKLRENTCVELPCKETFLPWLESFNMIHSKYRRGDCASF